MKMRKKIFIAFFRGQHVQNKTDQFFLDYLLTFKFTLYRVSLKLYFKEVANVQ